MSGAPSQFFSKEEVDKVTSRSNAVVLIDNSNIWIQGKKICGELQLLLGENPHWRINADRLIAWMLKEAGLPASSPEEIQNSIAYGCLFGSTPPPNGHLWQQFCQHVDVDLTPRNPYTNTDKRVDAKFVNLVDRDSANLFERHDVGIKSAFDYRIYCLATGDTDYFDMVYTILDRGLRVYLFSWKNSLGSKYLELMKGFPMLLKIVYLDSFIHEIGFEEEVVDASTNPNPADCSFYIVRPDESTITILMASNPNWEEHFKELVCFMQVVIKNMLPVSSYRCVETNDLRGIVAIVLNQFVKTDQLTGCMNRIRAEFEVRGFPASCVMSYQEFHRPRTNTSQAETSEKDAAMNALELLECLNAMRVEQDDARIKRTFGDRLMIKREIDFSAEQWSFFYRKVSAPPLLPSPSEPNCYLVHNLDREPLLLMEVDELLSSEAMIQLLYKYPNTNLCIRHREFTDTDFELQMPIPAEMVKMVIAQNQGIQVASIVDVDGYLGGHCIGPKFDYEQGTWTSEPALWIFSRWKGFLPTNTPTETIPILCFQYHPKWLYGDTASPNECFGGLQLLFPAPPAEDGIKCFKSQSIGVSIQLCRNNEIIRGFVTTRHGVLNSGSYLGADEKAIIRVRSESGLDNHHIGVSRTFTNYPIPYAIKLNEGETVVNVDPDFVEIECGDDFTMKLVGDGPDGECKRELMAGIPNIDEVRSLYFGEHVKKSGYKTGTTRAHHISTFQQYKRLVSKAPKIGVYPASADQNFPDFESVKPNVTPIVSLKDSSPDCQFLLLHDESGGFALHGDSGGLCWVDDETKAIPIGIVIGKVHNYLFIVLPLAFIDAVLKQEGYDVSWVV